MILTCPKCATRYLVDDGEMRPEGRKVKCAACGEEWRVSADGEDQSAPVATAPPAAPPAPEEPPPAPEILEDTLGEDTPVEAPVRESLFVAPIPTESKPQAPKDSAVASNLLLLVVVLAVVAVAGYAFRTEIVRIAPATAGIYSTLGIPVKPVGPPPAAPPSPATATSQG